VGERKIKFPLPYGERGRVRGKEHPVLSGHPSVIGELW